jgi:hypothetical protein
MSVSSTTLMAVLERVSRRNSRGMRRKADISRRRGRSLHTHGEAWIWSAADLQKGIIMDCLFAEQLP